MANNIGYTLPREGTDCVVASVGGGVGAGGIYVVGITIFASVIGGVIGGSDRLGRRVSGGSLPYVI